MFSVSELYCNNTFAKILQQIRKIIKTFRRPPVKNSVLQKIIKGRFGKPLQLVLDVETRWISTDSMLKRYIKLHECVNEALVELKAATSVSPEDFTMLNSLFKLSNRCDWFPKL